MKREYWFFIGGLFLGLMLGGVQCSLKVNQSPSPQPAVSNTSK